MSLLSLAYLLLDRPMQRRFEADPLFQATLLLLQERVPQAARRSTRTPPERADAARAAERAETPMRVFTDAGHAASRRCSCCPTAATT